MADLKQAGQELAEKTIRAIVARGRSISIPTKQNQVVGYKDDGKPIYRSVLKSFIAGDEVELPESEISFLRERGFLTIPGQIQAPLADGSHVIEANPV
jgi:hypothetical protein